MTRRLATCPVTVGAAVGLAAIAAEDQRECDPLDTLCDRTRDNYAAAALLLGGVGAGIGLGLDALIHRDRTADPRARGARTRLMPVLGRRMRGAVVSVAW